MQLEALKIFCDVARLGSFSRGAEANDVLQSAASQTVHQLEKRLGVGLIDRSCRPWKLTPEGRTFYEGCRELVDRYFELETQVRGIHQTADAVVRVAAIYSVGLGDMSQLVQQFAALYPQARVQIEYLHPDRVYDGVLEEKVDLGIVSFPQARSEFTVTPWRQEPMVLVCHPQHRLAGQKKVALKQLAGEKFVGFDHDLTIRRKIDQFLKQHGVAVAVALEFDNVEAIKRAVEIASGISILPWPTLEQEVRSGSLVAVPLTPGGLVRPLGIIHRRGRKLYPTTARFVELLQTAGDGNGSRPK